MGVAGELWDHDPLKSLVVGPSLLDRKYYSISISKAWYRPRFRRVSRNVRKFSQIPGYYLIKIYNIFSFSADAAILLQNLRNHLDLAGLLSISLPFITWYLWKLKIKFRLIWSLVLMAAFSVRSNSILYLVVVCFIVMSHAILCPVVR